MESTHHAEPDAVSSPEPPADPSALQSTGFLLSAAGRVLREHFEQALAPLGLRARHIGVLGSLKRWGPLPQGTIAARQWIDKSTMVAVVDDLERAGLVQRRRSTVDRRAYELTLTAAGDAQVRAADALVAAQAHRWFAPLDPTERAQLDALLLRLLYAPGGLLAEDDAPAAE